MKKQTLFWVDGECKELGEDLIDAMKFYEYSKNHLYPYLIYTPPEEIESRLFLTAVDEPLEMPEQYFKDEYGLNSLDDANEVDFILSMDKADGVFPTVFKLNKLNGEYFVDDSDFNLLTKGNFDKSTTLHQVLNIRSN